MAFDPFEVQKRLLQEWEKNLARHLDQTMRQPDFMQMVRKNLDASLDLHALIKNGTQETLASLSIPTQEDLRKIYLVLNRIETRLLDLEERLDGVEASRTVPAPPPLREADPPADPPPAARTAGGARGPSTPRRPVTRAASPPAPSTGRGRRKPAKRGAS